MSVRRPFRVTLWRLLGMFTAGTATKKWGVFSQVPEVRKFGDALGKEEALMQELVCFSAAVGKTEGTFSRSFSSRQLWDLQRSGPLLARGQRGPGTQTDSVGGSRTDQWGMGCWLLWSPPRPRQLCPGEWWAQHSPQGPRAPRQLIVPPGFTHETSSSKLKGLGLWSQ